MLRTEVDAKALGAQTALTLMKEMRFLKPIPDTGENKKSNDELVDMPDKCKLSFQIVDGTAAVQYVSGKIHAA